ESWRASIDRIAAWRPDTLFVTHFGAYGSPAPHLAALGDHLDVTSELVRRSLQREGSDEDREAWFADEIRRILRAGGGDAQAYEVAGRFDLSWRGLAR